MPIHKTGLKLVLVPLRTFEAVVTNKSSMNGLLDNQVLRSKLSPDERYFYSLVNIELNKFLPEEILNAFEWGANVIDETLVDPSGALAYKATLDDDINVWLDKLVRGNTTKEHLRTTPINKDNYVGQYFSINQDTIGVLLVPSNYMSTSYRESVENLITTLDDHGVFGGGDKIQSFADSGLLTHYCQLLTNPKKET